MALKKFDISSLSAANAQKLADAFTGATMIVSAALPAGKAQEEYSEFCKLVDDLTPLELRFNTVEADGKVHVSFSKKLQR